MISAADIIQDDRKENLAVKNKVEGRFDKRCWTLDQPLTVADPEISELIKQEAQRQFRGLELIASENYTSLAVLQATGSLLTNRYAEGLPNARVYGGKGVVDKV